ncbi:MAG: MBL fold metallo-hydrolase, partial [Patescibacteria group bacterium]
LTHPGNKDMSHREAVQGEPLVFAGPGELTGNGFTLNAIPWQAEDGSERAIHRWQIENVTLLNLASLNRELASTELQEIEKTDIDVLLVPIGGGSSLTTKQALKMITTIEPRLVIPIYYALPGLTEKLESVTEFSQAFGLKSSEAQNKILIKASRLSQEDMQVAVLVP